MKKGIFAGAIGLILIVGIVYELSGMVKPTEKEEEITSEEPKAEPSALPLPDHPGISEDQLDKTIKSVLVPLEEGVYATYQKENLSMDPDMEVLDSMSIAFYVSSHIFFQEALALGIKADQDEITRELEEQKIGENKVVHEQNIKESGISPDLYWHEVQKELEKDSVVFQFLDRKIGKPEIVGGAEYKRAQNELVKQTFLDHIDKVQVNESMITFNR
ncbi:hypothetical protein [Bacillus sp. V59.32b]|uniref:hypothetical protein n=1 Tax=Bacillus sp. V59.32b TaxID=1758642 RepID=UPI000E3DB08E|nr:hypothetical protein [Bacillus sp. V59.32b]RFU60689.1 hypothetical protein D0463_16445 [Bacillus sp. V59.32b]